MYCIFHSLPCLEQDRWGLTNSETAAADLRCSWNKEVDLGAGGERPNLERFQMLALNYFPPSEWSPSVQHQPGGERVSLYQSRFKKSKMWCGQKCDGHKEMKIISVPGPSPLLNAS